VVPLGEGLVGNGVHLGGVDGEIGVGQMGIGLAGGSEGDEVGPPLRVGVFGEKLICSVVIWQKMRKVGAMIWLIRSRLANRFLPSSFEMRTSSTGHLAGDRAVVPPSVGLWAGTSRMCLVGI
jgi:hypothetical protein